MGIQIYTDTHKRTHIRAQRVTAMVIVTATRAVSRAKRRRTVEVLLWPGFIIITNCLLFSVICLHSHPISTFSCSLLAHFLPFSLYLQLFFTNQTCLSRLGYSFSLTLPYHILTNFAFYFSCGFVSNSQCFYLGKLYLLNVFSSFCSIYYSY